MFEAYARVFHSLPFAPAGLPKLQMPQRPMLLFTGPLSAATTSFAEEPWEQSPSLWRPDDRAWCVATDVDLPSTYVGGSEQCIADLVADPDIEAMAVTVDQSVTFDADQINPPPQGRSRYG